MDNYYSRLTDFYGNTSPRELIHKYGSPLYVYNESILRQRCREMASLVSYPRFTVNYSCKANTNLELLKIIHQEGIHADAISPGEVHVLQKAGYRPEEIFYISNNISREEMRTVTDMGIIISIDSLSQLEQLGEVNPGGNVAIRLNPGLGVGHHKKVITAGDDTKFGIDLELIPEVKDIANRYDLKIVGLNQHLGSLFMKGDIFVEGAKLLLAAAKGFHDLDFIDIGGGFGIPYRKQDNEPRLELNEFGDNLSAVLSDWAKEYGKQVEFIIE
ncbi:MAG TPA: diaminopimelate decarboxylase, partial [Clostridia bacterium]|nr:diaminopimelate decarboxylase [Clostridia bacterium]